ncbi:MAG: hypothetical protein PHO74_04565 [Weeksellaceae bacterium]|jgi:hypothetical protein|nr:hypothetical protein [Weeksellaceae bacterium]
MKKLLIVAVTIFFAGLTQAQVKSQQNAVNVNFEKYSDELQLTEAQKSEILAIHKKYTEKKVAIRGTGTSENFKALNEAKQKEIEAVLNENQLKTMEKIKIQEAKDNKAKEFQKPKQ